MNFFLGLIIFVLGTIIGSFLNVVIFRYNTGKGIFGSKERSMCFSCGKKLNWHELIPVLSFLVQKGRCSECRSLISIQYPLVEILTGVLFLSIFLKNISEFGIGIFAGILILIHWAIWSILLVITVYDLRHKIIPDGLAYGFAGLSIISSILLTHPISSIIAGLLFFGFFSGLWFLSEGRWLGFGDAKLSLGVGFLLGFVEGLSALTIAFWIGAIISIFLIVLGKGVIRSLQLRGLGNRFTMKSEIPFAPFIILGTLVAYFWKVDVFGITSLFL